MPSTGSGDLGDEATEQLALQSEQQRCIDAAERDLAMAESRLDDAAVLSAEVLQPLVECDTARVQAVARQKCSRAETKQRPILAVNEPRVAGSLRSRKPLMGCGSACEDLLKDLGAFTLRY